MKKTFIKAMVKTTFTLVFLLSFVVTTKAQSNLNQGLMAWYPFNGNANDSSGNGNNPSFNNAKLTSDRFGTPNSAYKFNGFSSYIQIPNSSSLNSTNKLSFSLWINVSGFYGGSCHGNVVLSKGIATAAGIYDLFFDDGPFYNFQNCSIPQVDTIHQSFYSAGVITKSPFISKNTWYHVVYTNDGDSARMYLNGNLIGTAYSPQTFTNTSDLVFGKNYQPNIYWLNGTLDDIRIYNRALNKTEIDSLYNYQPKPDLNLGLMAWYPFNGNANDSSGNANNPSFNNAKLTSDRFGNLYSAYQFDGASTYMKVPNSTTLNAGTQLTMSLWVKPKAFFKGQCAGNYVITKGLQTQLGVYNLVFGNAPYGEANNINFCNTPVDTSHESFYGAGIGKIDSATIYLRTNKWYHVVMIYDGTKSYMYVNDKLTSIGIAATTFTNSTDLYIGAYQNLTYWLNGDLDDIRIYNRAIGKTEVDSLYGDNKGTPLPLLVKEFTATPITAPYVSLKIGTANEQNMNTIEIEKSYDGINYGFAGTLAAKGNTGVNLYSFIDKTDGIATKIFYRLKLVNKDGSHTYSNIASVTLTNSLKTFTAEVYPNPVHNVATINLYSIKDEALAIRIFDINGKLVYTQKNFSKKGFSTLSIPAFKSLAAGTYTINITNNTDVVNKKVIKY